MKVMMFSFIVIVLDRCWFNFMVILEAVVSGAVELYYIILRDVTERC